MLIKGSFEDFFYILVGLIWVAFSIYKGVQKKKAQGIPAKSRKKKSMLETLLDEFLEKQEQPEPEPVVYEASPEPADIEEETRQEVFSYDDLYEKSNYSEVSEVYEKKPEPKTNLKTKLTKPTVKRKKPRFNLRKAVIYSELLNRRYI